MTQPHESKGKRNLADWLSSYLEYTDNQESPEQLHFWTGISILSAALRRRVYLDRGLYKLYPNTYVIIVGESAKIRKSVAMDTGISILKEAVPDIHMAIGRATPEGLVKQMNRVTTEPNLIKTESHIFIHADELATFFGFDKMAASRMAILLTQIYSAKAEYQHLTKGDAEIMLKNLYPTLLAGTDPRNLKVLPEEAVGGLLGRTIFVTAAKRRKKVAWPSINTKTTLRTDLIVDLARISSLQGEVVRTPEAENLFSEWYDKFSDMEITDPKLDAFHERAHDTALKIATLLSISQSNSLILERKHVEAGISIIEHQLSEFSRAMNWAGASLYAQNRAKFLDLLKRHKGTASRKTMMRGMGISSDDMTSLTISLVEEGAVSLLKVGTEIIVKLTPDEVAKEN